MSLALAHQQQTIKYTDAHCTIDAHAIHTVMSPQKARAQKRGRERECRKIERESGIESHAHTIPNHRNITLGSMY